MWMCVGSVVVVVEVIIKVEGIVTDSLMIREVDVNATADSKLPDKDSVAIAAVMSNANGTMALVVNSYLFSVMVMHNILSRIRLRLRGDQPRLQIDFLFVHVCPK